MRFTLIGYTYNPNKGSKMLFKLYTEIEITLDIDEATAMTNTEVAKIIQEKINDTGAVVTRPYCIHLIRLEDLGYTNTSGRKGA